MMASFYSSTICSTYSQPDRTANSNSTESLPYETTDTASHFNHKVEELLQDIKAPIIYPWMVLPPSGKFVKPFKIFKSVVYDRKMFINAYKAAAKK
jgi:hypothetical protein